MKEKKEITMYCNVCGKKIPEESIYCMFCGSEIGKQSSNYPETEKEVAYEMLMKDYVLKKLKAPTTATWPKFSEAMVSHIDKKLLSPAHNRIETYVDSQNSYGATIRTGIRINVGDESIWTYKGVAFQNPNGTWGLYLI